MSNLEERFKAHIEAITTDGELDKDKAQNLMLEQFVDALLTRQQETPVDAVVCQFAEQHSATLQWLGDTLQDEILIAAMVGTGIDLSHWIGE